MQTKHYKINGCDIDVSYLPLDGVEDILSEVFEKDVYRIAELHRSGARLYFVADVGCHMGFFGKLLKCYWPDVVVDGFEPQSELCEVAKANGTMARNFAVRYDGRNDFFVSPKTGGSVIFDGTVNFSEKIPHDYQHRKVLTVPLEVITWAIDLLKLDCEGSEFDILCGMTPEMRARIKSIRGEYHHLAGYRYIEQIIRLRYPHLMG